MLKGLGIAVVLALASGTAFAAEHEVHMRNQGEAGPMVFEPAVIKAAPGDTVRFIPSDKTHNVEGVKGMLPEGVEPFKGKTNEEYTLTLTQPGIYGVRCSPHFAMGMVALIQAGDNPGNLEAAQAVKMPGKAGERMKAYFAELTKP